MLQTHRQETLTGGGRMGVLIRDFDWADTPLGPRELWPQSLTTAVSIILNSQHPMWIGWGPENTFLYNDPYIEVLTLAKHPWALGRPAAEVWAEIWDVCGPLSDKVYEQGEAFYVSDVQLFMNRGDFIEETYYSFSYSPIFDENGRISGLFCPSAESTAKILSARRLGTLSELATRALSEKTTGAAYAAAAATLAHNRADLPFALLFSLESEGHKGRLAEVIASKPLPSALLDPDFWPITAVAQSMKPEIIDVSHISDLPLGLARQAVTQVIVLPLVQPGQERPTGILIAAINPCAHLNADYQTFFQLVSTQIATAVMSAQAYEAEKRRAEELTVLDQAKTAFFSNVSHEFRTPLTLMLGPLEDILGSPDDLTPRVRNDMEVVHRNSLRLLKLVNTLLDFSRIEAGRVRAHYENIDLAAMTTDLASVFRSTIERAGLRYDITCEAILEPTYIDHDMWEKIVLNLISNAFKFCLEGRIAVRLFNQDKRAVLEVTDTGTGIPADALPDLFKRFHRIEGARGRTHEGSGIGLALVHELVHLHGGTVTASSVYGEGTTFRVEIPTGSAHLPAERRQTDTRLPSTATRADAYVEEANRWLPATLKPVVLPLDSARVLLVDDNADMREYIQKLLNQHWQVTTASNGLEALELALHEPPDLVLTDVMMPMLDGFGLLKELRAHPSTRLIPVIMLSARAGEESRVEGMQAGADDYLVKPFSARELVARVGANLKMARIRHEAREREMILRQEAEEAHSQTLSVLESIGDGYMALDPSGIITYVNAHAEKINQVQRENLLGRNHWELYPQTVGTELQNLYEKAMRERVAVKFENWYEPMRRCFEVDAYPTKEGGLAVFFRDITERKELQQRQELARRELESIFKYAPVGIAVLEGNEFVFSLVNDEYMKLWGGARELLGRKVIDLVPDAREQGFLPILERVYQTGQPEAIREMPVRLRQVDGSDKEIFVAFVYAPKFDSFGCVNGIVAIVIDITPKHKAEQEREELLQHLTEVDRRKDEFLAVLSHELRSPLNVIGGHAELLRYEEPGTPEFLDSLDAIERNTKAQTQLIADLLDISRIVTGKFLLNISSFELATVISAALDAVRFAAESKSLVIGCSIDKALDSFVGDPMRIQQMIWNLLSNAVKFTPAGGRITLLAQQVQGAVQIEVQDTGQGVTAEFLPHVFDRFHQEDASNTRKFGGLGLGLSIVRHIAELHGGTVEATSAGKNQGTTFTVRLPRHNTKPAEFFDDTPVAARKEPARTLLGLTILIVDDQQDAREMVAKAFHFLGATSNLVPSGSAALELLTIKKFDAIICDIGMPDMSGLDFIRRWRKIEKERCLVQTPALALTAYASDGDRLDAMQAGFQGHLAKPIRISELSEAVAAMGRSGRML